MADGISPIERGLEAAGAAGIYRPFPRTTRRHLLPQSRGLSGLVFRSPSAIWGGIYVLEGSRIGAKVIARRNEVLGSHPFFSHSGSNRWQAFLSHLRAADDLLDDREGMEDGARLAFSAFFAADGTRARDGGAIEPERLAELGEPAMSAHLSSRKLSETVKRL